MVKIRKVAIIEGDSVWTVLHTIDNAMPYSTAMEALLAVQTGDRERAAANPKDTCVTVIEWTATSRVGKAVVTVLAR